MKFNIYRMAKVEKCMDCLAKEFIEKMSYYHKHSNCQHCLHSATV